MASSAVWSGPSGDLLAACCGGAVKVWSPASGANDANAVDGARLPAAAGSLAVAALDWSANNKVLAVAGDRPQVLMYGGGQLIGQVPAAGAPASSLGGASAASSAVTAATTTTTTPSAAGLLPLAGGITALRFGSDSKRMIVGCRSRAVHVLDLRQQGAVSRTNVDHRGAVCALAVAPGDAAVASSGEGGQLLLHDFRTAARLATLEGGGGGGGGYEGASSSAPARRALAFCPSDAELLAAAGDGGGVALWALRSRSLRAEWRGLHGGAGATGVCFQGPGAAPDVLLSVGRDRRLCVLDARVGGGGGGGSGGGGAVAGELRALQPLTCVAARHDGALVAAGTSGGGVLVFDARALGRGALHAYAFGGAAEPVREVRWQHAPSAGARARAAAQQARAAVGAESPAGAARSAANAGPPAPGQLQPPQRPADGYILRAKQQQEEEEQREEPPGAAFGGAGDAALRRRRQVVGAIGTVAVDDAAAADSYGGASRRSSAYYNEQQQQREGDGAGSDPSLLLLLPGGGGGAAVCAGPLSPVRRGALAAAAPASPSAASSQPAPAFGQPYARRSQPGGADEDASYQQQQQEEEEEEEDERQRQRQQQHEAAAAAAAAAPRRQPAVPPLGLRRASSQHQQQYDAAAPAPAASTTPRYGATAAAAAAAPAAGERRAPSFSLTPPRVQRAGSLATPRGAGALTPGAAAAAAGAAGLDAPLPPPHLPTTTTAGAPPPAGAVRAALDDAVACLRADLRAVHVEVVRQAAAAQLDLASVVSGLAARQDALASAVDALAGRLDAALAALAQRGPLGAHGAVQLPPPPQPPRASAGDLAGWLGH
jgi:hypothetical protein